MTSWSRRSWLGCAALVTLAAATRSAAALGRTPHGGQLRISLPWPITRVDPHALGDATGALFSSALFDSLYAVDGSGHPYPALAAALPESTPRGTRVRLRPWLVTAGGRALDSRDVVFSCKRARASGAAAVLAGFKAPTRDAEDPLAALFANADASALALALASPVTALVPRGFAPSLPDGTGAFAAKLGGGTLMLTRSATAARGAAFLDRVLVTQVSDLSGALRAFESGDADLGWLGRGLHRPRPDAVDFDAGAFGWVVLRSGAEAGAWAAPGVAQQLLDGVDASRLAHLGLAALPERPSGDPAWGGRPAPLLVASDAPHLVAIARELSAILSRPGHEVATQERPATEVAQRVASGRFALALDFVRRLGDGAAATQAALITAANPALAAHPPRAGVDDARGIARSLTLGVVGELHIAGAHAPELHGIASWNLGAVWR